MLYDKIITLTVSKVISVLPVKFLMRAIGSIAPVRLLFLQMFCNNQVNEKHLLGSRKLLGSFKLGLATVMKKQGIWLYYCH